MAVLGAKKSVSDLELLQEIDEFCIAFEEAWSDGVEPELPDFLSHFTGDSHGLALRELLWIEWDYLRRSGKSPRLDDYLARFPESADVVKEAWQVEQKRIAEGDPTAAPRGNRYRIIKSHARGGLGQVYVANDEEVGRHVALKEIRHGHAHDPNAQERLLREARITGRLEHPGIVPVFSVGQNTDGTPYYTMRFVHGDSLREAIACFHAKYAPVSRVADGSHQNETEGKKTSVAAGDASRSGQARKPTAAGQASSHLPPETFRSVEFRQLLARFAFVCHVVEYAHQHGVIHRDLKPSNIMLGKHDETLVVDWGLAKEMGGAEADDQIDETALLEASSRSDFTTHGATLGTPAYMSPEQAAGNLAAVGPASDIFSLGATLFQLLTGASPYADEATAALRERGRTGEPPRARKLQPAVPPPLDAICAQALAFEAADRYESAESMARDIENWLADGAVSAYVEPLSSRLGRWARRHRTLVRSSIVAIVLLTVSLAATAALTMLHNRDLSIAQQDTEAKRIVAENERDVSQAISNLVVEWLRSPDPDIDGRQVTVSELLDRAFENVKSDERIAPKSRLLLLQTLGDSYAGLGLFSRAAEVAEYTMGLSEFESLDAEIRFDIRLKLAKARMESGHIQRTLGELEELARETCNVLGPGNEVTLSAESILAAAYTSAGRPREGLRIADKAFELSRSKLGETHERTMLLALERARSLTELQRYDEAIAITEETVAWSIAEYGVDHSATLGAQNHLGLLYRRAGQHDRAIALQEETLAFRLDRFGPDHAHTLNTQDLLASAYVNAGRYEDAIRLHGDTLEKRKTNLGSNHRGTLRSMQGLGKSYAEAGRSEEAIPLLREAFDAQRQQLGEADGDTLLTHRALAMALMFAGQHAEAIPLLEQAVQRSSEAFGDDVSDVSIAKVELAVAYRQAGRLEEAIAIYRDLLPARTALLGPNHPEVLTLHTNLAAAYAAAGRLEEAVASFEQLLPVARAQMGPTDPQVWVIRLNMASCYRRLKKTDRMVRILEVTEPRIEEHLGWHHPRTLDWHVGLASAYTDLHRYDDALAKYQWLIGELEQNAGEDAPQTWAARRYFAGYLYEVGQYEKAAGILEAAVASLEKKLGTDNVQTQRAMRELSTLLRMAERFAEAEKVNQRLVDIGTRQKQPDQEFHSSNLLWLGMCQLKQQKFVAAESTLRECWNFRQRTTPADWRVASAESLLGEALTGCGRHDEAEERLVSAFKTLESMATHIPMIVREETLRKAATRLVQLYDATNRKELADQWRQRTESLDGASEEATDKQP